jgi:hypothetical protein
MWGGDAKEKPTRGAAPAGPGHVLPADAARRRRRRRAEPAAALAPSFRVLPSPSKSIRRLAPAGSLRAGRSSRRGARPAAETAADGGAAAAAGGGISAGAAPAIGGAAPRAAAAAGKGGRKSPCPGQDRPGRALGRWQGSGPPVPGKTASPCLQAGRGRSDGQGIAEAGPVFPGQGNAGRSPEGNQGRARCLRGRAAPRPGVSRGRPAHDSDQGPRSPPPARAEARTDGAWRGRAFGHIAAKARRHGGARRRTAAHGGARRRTAAHGGARRTGFGRGPVVDCALAERGLWPRARGRLSSYESSDRVRRTYMEVAFPPFPSPAPLLPMIENK